MGVEDGGKVRPPLPPSPSPVGEGAECYVSSWGEHASVERRAACREFRRELTPAESAFWERVRAGRFLGWKWRREHPIGRYVVDFVCIQARIVVELDGPVHEAQRERDAGRDAFLTDLGLRVVRWSNDDFLSDPDGHLRRLCPLSDRRGGRGERRG